MGSFPSPASASLGSSHAITTAGKTAARCLSPAPHMTATLAALWEANQATAVPPHHRSARGSPGAGLLLSLRDLGSTLSSDTNQPDSVDRPLHGATMAAGFNKWIEPTAQSTPGIVSRGQTRSRAILICRAVRNEPAAVLSTLVPKAARHHDRAPGHGQMTLASAGSIRAHVRGSDPPGGSIGGIRIAKDINEPYVPATHRNRKGSLLHSEVGGRS